MTSTKYQQMGIHELFAEMQSTAIREHEVFTSGEPISRQHEWVERLNAIQLEIQARGAEAESHYIPLLKADHPAVRLSAALALREIAPDLARPVLEELRIGKYGGTIAMNARMGL